MRYSCNDIFMVRTPSLPASVFSDFVQFEGNDVENFLQQTPFRDFMDKSILLSSRELYNAKKRNLQSSTKKSKARNLARIKFLIRACTRPTPYGLFAGAALGEFCENPNIEPLVIDERKAILECRADYSWLSHFIYEMENNPSVYPQLQLRFNNITFILQLVVLYVCIDLASTIISGLMNYYTTKFSLKFNLHIKDCIMQKASQLSLWHYENSNTYDKIKLAEGANGGTLMSQFTSFTTLIGQAITSLSYIVILLHFNYIIILIIVIMPIIKFLITNLINKKQFCIIKARTNQERKAWYYSFIVTNGTHFKELKTYNLLNYFIKKYDDLYKKFNQQDAAIAKETMVKMTSLSIIEQIITGAIFAYIIYCGFVGGILLGDVVAYTRAAISNQTNIQSILQNISSIKKSNLYIGQYYSFIDLENAKTLDEGKIIIDKIHSLKLENLSFKYDTGGYVLKNVNFEFKEGNSYAIVGKNGSGKTTLAKLLMGLYDNYEGNIYVNGIELRSIQKEHYSKRIASLFQDFIKYDATFRENIAYGNLDLMDKDAELRDLSNEFRIGHIIDHSKQNLDTQLGYWFDEGKQISFGEWQKLAIARTFSKDADVIFLDEPNSALDAISDYEISQLYQKLFQDKMGIIIAHKFNNLINQVNNILVIENGRLAESGTHTELLHQGKIYYEMYQLQNKNSAVL